MPAKSPASKEPEQTFESAIERLDRIVGEMESEKLPLEDLIVRYEEGTKLVRVCQEKLAAAEKRIEIITRDAQGKAQLAEFDPAAAESKKSPAAPREDVSLF